MTHPIDRERIVALRGKRGWSQEELAMAPGLNVRTIQRVESGASASLETRRALAAAFDVDLESLQTPAATRSDTARALRSGIGGASKSASAPVAAVSSFMLTRQVRQVAARADRSARRFSPA